jgi:hypothetical protein
MRRIQNILSLKIIIKIKPPDFNSDIDQRIPFFLFIEKI